MPFADDLRTLEAISAASVSNFGLPVLGKMKQVMPKLLDNVTVSQLGEPALRLGEPLDAELEPAWVK
jgi:hypothetical protein